MSSTKKHLVPDAQVKVQKVKKIPAVYDPVIRPPEYKNKLKMQKAQKVMDRPVAEFFLPGMTKKLSRREVEDYISRKKEGFQQENKQEDVQKKPYVQPEAQFGLD